MQLIPNVVLYENWTVIDGDHIELSEEKRLFLAERGHQLQAKAGGAISQLVVQTLDKPIEMGRKNGKHFIKEYSMEPLLLLVILEKMGGQLLSDHCWLLIKGSILCKIQGYW